MWNTTFTSKNQTEKEEEKNTGIISNNDRYLGCRQAHDCVKFRLYRFYKGVKYTNNNNKKFKKKFFLIFSLKFHKIAKIFAPKRS